MTPALRPRTRRAADIKILVVDDSSTMRRIVRGLLRECGDGSVEEAEDGAAALVKPFTKAPLEDKVARIVPKLAPAV